MSSSHDDTTGDSTHDSGDQKEALRQKLKMRLSAMENGRTGRTYRMAAKKVPKSERAKIRKDVQKHGLYSLAKQLGVENEPDILRRMHAMIRTGEVTEAEELVKRIGELQAKKRSETLESELKDLTSSVSPQTVADQVTIHDVLNVPSAHQARGTLKSLTQALRERQNEIHARKSP